MTPKLRILFVSHTYVVSAVYQQKLDALVRTGQADVALLVPGFWKSRVWNRTFRLERWSERVRIFEVPAMLNGREGAYLLEPLSALRAISRFRPDVIQVEQEVFALSAFEMSCLRVFHRCPLIFFGWENLDRSLGILRRLTRRAVLNSADAVISGNGDNESLIRKWGYRGQAWKLPQLGVDTALFHPCRHLNQDADFTVAFLGRLVPEKGLDILLNALASLRAKNLSLRLIVCGTGPEEKNLVETAIRVGLQDCVTWNGTVAHLDVPGVLSEVDVLVLPSRTASTWKEQLGHVLLEAMAMGIPVVGSSSGEIPNVIGRNDLIFREGDPASLAQILERLYTDLPWRAEVSKYCINRVQRHYTNERIAEQLLEIYRALLPEKNFAQPTLTHAC